MRAQHRSRRVPWSVRHVLCAAAGVTALGLCTTGVAVPTPSSATASVAVTRLSGPDRYATSAAASRAAFPAATTVVLASGELYADGLSAAALAGQLGAPVLLVPSAGTLPAPVRDEIARLGASIGVIIGGRAAVTTAMQDRLTGAGLSTVVRHAGVDRYDTSRTMARALDRIGTDDGKVTAFVAAGEGGGWADALVASAPAFAATMPVILTRPDSLSASAEAALTEESIERVVLVGGTASVSHAVQAQIEALGVEVRRIAGATRADTAAALATYLTADGDFAFADTGVVLVPSTDFPDALAAGSFAGTRRYPILFAAATVPAATRAYLTGHRATLTTVRVIGGPDTIPDVVISELQDAAGGGTAPTPPTEIVFGPDGDQTVELDGTATRSFLATGLREGLTYGIDLVDAGSVARRADGTPVFNRDVATGLVATGSDPTRARLSAVGGMRTSGTGTASATATPVSGAVAVTVEGLATSSYYAVIHATGETGAAKAGRSGLQIDAGGLPTQAYGITGRTTFLPPGAAGGPVPVGSITWVDKPGGTLVTPAGTYRYDDNDTFTAGGVPVTFAAFLALLSRGDALVGGTYAVDPSLRSRFEIDDLTPMHVTQVAAVAVDSDTVEVTWAPGSPVPTAYTVYRKAGVPTDALSDYTRLASVPAGATPPAYADQGLVPETQYAYAVTQTLDQDESALGAGAAAGASTDDATTTAPGVRAAFESISVAVTTDAGFSGEVDPGDVWTIGWNIGRGNRDPGDYMRVQDADGESFDVVLWGPRGGPVNEANPRTFQGSVFPTRALHTKTFQAVDVPDLRTLVDRDGTAANNNGVLDYPLEIVNAKDITAPVGGVQVPWVPIGDPDTTLETGVAAPYSHLGPLVRTVTFVPPTSGGTSFDNTGDTIEIVFYEPLSPPVAGDSVTIGGVRLQHQVNAAFSLSADQSALTVNWVSADIDDARNKTLTATSGIKDAATGLPPYRFPFDVN